MKENRFCAFLRGVNVKGTSMKMADVCAVFEKAGMKNVLSVLATGNILFNSDKTASELKIILEKALSEHFNYEAFLFIKSAAEVSEVFKNSPFEKADHWHNYVFVSTEGTEKFLLDEFNKGKKSQNEKAEIVGNTFYWQVEKGNTLDSDFGKILGRKALKDQITSRNINTFEKIVSKL